MVAARCATEGDLLSVQIRPMAASTFVSPVALGWVVTAVTVALALRAPRLPDAVPASARHPALGPLVVALAVIGTRLVLRPRFFGDWFLGDEMLSGCINPFDLQRGATPWADHTHYLSFAITLATYGVFGFSPPVARLRNILAVAAAAALFHVAIRRATDRRFAWISSLVIILAGPYVAQSLFATEIGLSLVPTAIALLLLVGAVTAPRAFALGPLAAAAMFVYPSSPIAIAALTVAHALVFRHRWSRTAGLAGVAGFGAGAILVPLVRWLVTGGVRTAQWSGGGLDLASVPAGLRMLANDVVLHSDSFDAVNLNAPYVDTALLGFVVVGIAAGWRARDTRWRWACVGVVAFVASLLAASVTGANPGIRRAFAAQPFLAFAIARGVIEFRRRAPRSLAAALPLVALGLVVWHTVRLVASWYLLPVPEFMPSARAVLAAEQMAGRDVVVVGEREDPYGGQAFSCALALDRPVASRLGNLLPVRRAELAMLRNPPRGPLVVLASQPIDEGQLAKAFGRGPAETIPRQPTGHDPLALRMVYLLPPA